MKMSNFCERWAHWITFNREAHPMATRFLCSVILVLGLAACHEETALGPLRMIAEAPQSLFDLDSLETIERRSLTWSFVKPADLDGWRCIEIDSSCAIREGALKIRSTSSVPRLTRTVRLTAEHISMLEIEASGPRVMHFFWAGAGEHFSPKRKVSLRPENPSIGGRRVFRTYLAQHPLWKGQIQKVRLDPTHVPNQKVEIVQIRALREEIHLERLASLAGSTWKVDLAGDVRNAWINPPGHVIEHDVKVPREAQLQFSIGSLYGVTVTSTGPDEIPPTSEPARFQVSVTRSGQDPSLIFESAHESLASKRSWAEEAIDLSDYAGQQIRLSFKVQELLAGESLDGLPVWAGPRLVSSVAESDRPNVLLISIDTLRADHLSLNGYSRATSPRIDAWAERRGVNFQNVIAPSPITLPSHASLFSGLDPLHQETHYGAAVPEQTLLLAESLRDAGYSTAAITGGVMLHPRFGFTQGFDRYYYWSHGLGGEKDLENGIHRALEFIDGHTGGPFFLFFHTYAVHAPYQAREPFHSRFGKQQWQDKEAPVRAERIPPTAGNGFVTSFRFTFRNSQPVLARDPSVDLRSALTALYDSGIAYADKEIGRLLERIEQLGLAENTLVVLTSDHGESLGEQGRATHYHLYDEVLRVPLVMALPGTPPPKRSIEDQVRLIDVAPTVLEIIDLPALPDIDGVSLLAMMNGSAPPKATTEAWSYAPMTNWGVSLRLENRFKYLLFNSPWKTGRGLDELYDLRDDPDELRNLADLKTRESDLLRSRVQSALEQTAGLRLRLFNRGEGVLSGRLQGKFSPNAVKSSRGFSDSLKWERGAILFRLAASETRDITIEAPGKTPFLFQGSWRAASGQPRPFRWSLEPPESGESRAFLLNATGWTESDHGDGKVGILASQVGRTDAEPVAITEDEQLLRAMRALGYIQ